MKKLLEAKSQESLYPLRFANIYKHNLCFIRNFFQNNLSFRRNRFQSAELDYLQLNYDRLLDLMSNSELKVVLQRMVKFEILFRKSV